MLEELKQIRIINDYDVYDFANKVGVSHTWVYSTESGKREISEKYIKKLCKVFPAHTVYLLNAFYNYKIKILNKQIIEYENKLKAVKNEKN